jgi:hypothetical protein
MEGSSTATDWWTVQCSIAQFQCGFLTGRLDISHPGHGLHHLALDGHAFDARLLCIYRISERAKPVEYPTSSTEHVITKGPEWMVADSYVRGRDLVASYLPTKEWPYSPEVYWRACSESEASPLASISLILSVNTHLLDSWPRISLQSCFTTDEVMFLQADSTKANTDVIRNSERVFRPSSTLSCRLHRLSDQRFSYAEIMPATDFCEARIQHNADNKCYARWELFSHFLEKGVIRRARLQAIVLPRENDVELALRCCRQLENAPLPLTT